MGFLLSSGFAGQVSEAVPDAEKKPDCPVDKGSPAILLPGPVAFRPRHDRVWLFLYVPDGTCDRAETQAKQSGRLAQGRGRNQ